jgi:hypothetical protein
VNLSGLEPEFLLIIFELAIVELDGGSSYPFIGNGVNLDAFLPKFDFLISMIMIWVN